MFMPNSSIISHTIPNLVGIQMYYIPPEVVDPLATPIYQNWESNIIIDEVGNRTQYDASTNPDNVLLYSWNMEYQEAVEPEAPKNYFYIKNEDSVQISILYSNGNNQYVNYKMQTDNEWQTCSAGQRIQINPSEICQFKRNAFAQAGNNNPHAGAFNNATGLHSVGGNVMSLLYDDDFEDKVALPSVTQGTAVYHFNGLFWNNSSLISASNLSLPATTLSYNCYFQMFYGCTSLVDAPELPATTLTSNCYNQMFSGCSSLTTAPELPATAQNYGELESNKVSGNFQVTAIPQTESGTKTTVLDATTVAINDNNLKCSSYSEQSNYTTINAPLRILDDYNIVSLNAIGSSSRINKYSTDLRIYSQSVFQVEVNENINISNLSITYQLTGMTTSFKTPEITTGNVTVDTTAQTVVWSDIDLSTISTIKNLTQMKATSITIEYQLND